MFHNKHIIIALSLVGLIAAGIIGCQMSERQPTAPAGGAVKSQARTR